MEATGRLEGGCAGKPIDKLARPQRPARRQPESTRSGQKLDRMERGARAFGARRRSPRAVAYVAFREGFGPISSLASEERASPPAGRCGLDVDQGSELSGAHYVEALVAPDSWTDAPETFANTATRGEGPKVRISDELEGPGDVPPDPELGSTSDGSQLGRRRQEVLRSSTRC